VTSEITNCRTCSTVRSGTIQTQLKYITLNCTTDGLQHKTSTYYEHSAVEYFVLCVKYFLLHMNAKYHKNTAFRKQNIFCIDPRINNYIEWQFRTIQCWFEICRKII